MSDTWTPQKVAAKVAAIIRDTPEKWEQNLWLDPAGDLAYSVFPVERAFDCGTRACVAGWAALVAAPQGSTFNDVDSWLVLPDGSRVTISEFGADALGLSDEDRDDEWDFPLFASSASEEYVLAELDRIAGNDV